MTTAALPEIIVLRLNREEFSLIAAHMNGVLSMEAAKAMPEGARIIAAISQAQIMRAALDKFVEVHGQEQLLALGARFIALMEAHK